MPNPFFQFKQFTVYHDRCAMKVTTDSCLFGAWCAHEMQNGKWKLENVLDVGGGTGLLSLMIAQKNNVFIDAVEIDKEGSEQAQENIRKSLWSNTVKVYNEDILNFSNQIKYDCIISNPPFYENELHSEDRKKNLAHHSHQLKLSELLKEINNRLHENGVFFLLLPYKRLAEAEQVLQQSQLFIDKMVIVKQSVLHSPFRVMLRGSKQKKVRENSELSIWDEQQQYTDEFIHLLKDYYLYL